MHPILGRYGPIVIYSFTAVLSLGILLSLGIAAWQNQRIKLPRWPDVLLVGSALALLVGRAGFVWSRWDYYQSRPSQILQLWQGGLSYHGVLIGGMAGVWLWGRRQRWSTADISALIAPILPLLSGFGWLACWLAGCAYGSTPYGRAAPLGWLTADLPDEFGLFAVRYQTQLLGILAMLLVCIGLWRLCESWSPWRQFTFSLGLVSLAHGGIGLLRGDTAVYVNTLRLDILLDLALVFLALLLLKYPVGEVTKIQS